MSLIYFFFLFVLITLNYVFVFKLRNRSRKLMLALICFWLIVLVAPAVYLLNPQVRVQVNVYLNPSREHTVYGHREERIPLPATTSFAYRFSHEGAAYYTLLSEQQIVEFFAALSNNEVLPGTVNENRQSFFVYYGNDCYELVFRDQDREKGVYFSLELMI